MRGVRRLFMLSIAAQAFLAQMNAKDKAFVDACGSLIIEPEIVPFMIEDEAANVNLFGHRSEGYLFAEDGRTTVGLGKTTRTQR